MSLLDARPETLNDILRRRALCQPHRAAYTFLVEAGEEKVGLTYAELDCRARAIAAWLQGSGAGGGRALLIFPPGLDFVAAFFGCLYAGVTAVPAYPPHPARARQTVERLRALIADAQVSSVMTTSTLLARMQPLFAESPGLEALKWVAADVVALDLAPEWREPIVSGQTLAFLQYTSGSTSAPKGVMVSHENLLSNSAYIQSGFEHTPDSVAVSWLPAYHDMGLIDGIVQPLYSGFPCYLMPPASFLQRPARWLQAITRYKATHSGGPNFAYEMCVSKVSAEQRAELDLSSWSVAYNGAEPVRFETLKRFAEAFGPCGFRPQAFYPAYGLAEATLKVSGGAKSAAPLTCTVASEPLEQGRVVEASTDEPNARRLVSSGGASHGTEVVIVDPSTLNRCEADQVGEVWVSGPGVAQGYWNKPELTGQTFRARLADTSAGPFLRTGDLGFVKGGEVFITGRLRDLIIIGGRNHYPQDIELTAEQSHPALRPGCVAAFSVEVEGQEHLVLAAEVERHYRTVATENVPATTPGAGERPSLDVKALTRALRRAVSEIHGIQIHALALLKTGGVPKTSSGKIRRHACRDNYLNGTLELLAAS